MAALFEPCPHHTPNAGGTVASELHGVCIFCWRDRWGALKAERDALRFKVERLRGNAAKTYEKGTLDQFDTPQAGTHPSQKTKPEDHMSYNARREAGDRPVPALDASGHFPGCGEDRSGCARTLCADARVIRDAARTVLLAEMASRIAAGLLVADLADDVDVAKASVRIARAILAEAENNQREPEGEK